MRITTDENEVSWAQVVELLRAVGWSERDPDDMRAAFGKSSIKAFAFSDDELIGFGRTIDDGKYYATVVDVVVSPSQRGLGVGRAIVESLQQRLRDFLLVTLIAAPDVYPFYRKLGWRRTATGMMLPRSAEQARRHCIDDEQP